MVETYEQAVEEMFTTPDSILGLSVADLGLTMLQLVNTYSLEMQQRMTPADRFLTPVQRQFASKGHHVQTVEAINRRIFEAWGWLQSNGFIARNYEINNVYWLTDRGRSVISEIDLDALKRAVLLPKELLRPKLAQRVLADFTKGDYASAVFKAFRLVEVCVRETGGYGREDIGVNLMTEAFRSTSGNLAYKELPVAEQEAMMSLFRGAIGLLKNPSSHHEIEIDSIDEAVGAIMFANFLLGYIERSPATQID